MPREDPSQLQLLYRAQPHYHSKEVNSSRERLAVASLTSPFVLVLFLIQGIKFSIKDRLICAHALYSSKEVNFSRERLVLTLMRRHIL